MKGEEEDDTRECGTKIKPGERKRREGKQEEHGGYVEEK